MVVGGKCRNSISARNSFKYTAFFVASVGAIYSTSVVCFCDFQKIGPSPYEHEPGV